MSNSKTFRFENLKKVEIIKGTKRAAKKWSDKSNHVLHVDSNLYNTALITGKENNLIVIDIDFNDDISKDGLIEFEKYCKINDIKTVMAKTINGGYHLYYQYKSSNKND